MQRFIIRRVGQALITLFLLSLVVFISVSLTGDPAEKLLGEDATPEMRTQLSPNPPKDTDGRREDSGRGVRELQARLSGLDSGRREVAGRPAGALGGADGGLRWARGAR